MGKTLLGPTPLLPGFLLNLTSPVLPSCSLAVPTKLSWHACGLPGLSRLTNRSAMSQLSAAMSGLFWTKLMRTSAIPCASVSGGFTVLGMANCTWWTPHRKRLCSTFCVMILG